MLRRISAAPSRAEQVCETIRNSICDCTLRPGAHLVQEELADLLGVSRQPIQQAMLVLKSEGLVVELPGRGLCVAPLEPEPVRHRYEIRLVLDQLAARLVAAQAAASKDFAMRLKESGEELVSEGETARSARDDVGAVNVDVAFHTLIYRMSGNPLIEVTAQPHWMFLRRMMILVLSAAQRGEIVWNQHWSILEALVAGDVEAADRLARQHVLTAQSALLTVMASNPEIASGAL